MYKRLIIMMAILGTLFACKSKEETTQQKNGSDVITTAHEKDKPAMPEGRLMRVTYFRQGMMIEEFSRFELQRQPEGCTLTFRHYSDKLSFEVSDTLLDAARRIIEQERMYEYAPNYSLDSDIEVSDGYFWAFEAWFEGDRHLSSGGEQAGPDGNGLYLMGNLLRDAARRVFEAASK
jgi:hypothetical protein